MKKMLVRAAVLAMFTAGIATATGIAGAGSAMACGNTSARSDGLASSLPQVNYGDRGGNVVALQLALREEGYKLQGTGLYAGNTLAAVKDFQRKNGIKASGIVGSKTWHALVGKKTQAITGLYAQFKVINLTPGSRNLENINKLHNMLWRIHPYTQSIDSIQAERDAGIYGPKAQKMVKDFQRRAGIKASGIVGPKTSAAMHRAISVSGQWGC